MMRLTVHQAPADFLALVHQLLLSEEAANNLMLGIALQLANGTYAGKSKSYLATVSDEHGLILAALRTPPHPLTLYRNRTEDSHACELVANDLYARQVVLPAVSGRTPIAQEFAELWGAKTDQISYAHMRMRIFELRRINLMASAPGAMRLATAQDIDLVTDWTLRFIAEANLHDDVTEVPQVTQRKIEAGSIYLWHLDENVVSMAAKARPMEHGISVNLVYTPRELRGRGYSTACVTALSRLLLDEGWSFCSLFTDLSNPTSNRIYQKIGYQPICDFDEYVFQPKIS